MLTQEDLKFFCTYDSETGIFIRNFTQGKNKKGSKIGSNCIGYRETTMFGGRYFLHRLAFLYMTGSMPKGEVDHINHDRADNRWENLRDVTKKENTMNKTIRPSNSSGYTGVCWCKNSRKWMARISKKYIGKYENISDAIKAREDAQKMNGYHENHGKLI